MMITLTEEQIVQLRDALLAQSPVPDPDWYSEMTDKIADLEMNAQSITCSIDMIEVGIHEAEHRLSEASNYLYDAKSDKKELLSKVSELQTFVEETLSEMKARNNEPQGPTPSPGLVVV